LGVDCVQPVHRPRARAARLGGAARRGSDRARHDRPLLGRPAWQDDLQRRLLRGGALDARPGDDARVGRGAARRGLEHPATGDGAARGRAAELARARRVRRRAQPCDRRLRRPRARAAALGARRRRRPRRRDDPAARQHRDPGGRPPLRARPAVAPPRARGRLHPLAPPRLTRARPARRRPGRRAPAPRLAGGRDPRYGSAGCVPGRADAWRPPVASEPAGPGAGGDAPGALARQAAPPPQATQRAPVQAPRDAPRQAPPPAGKPPEWRVEGSRSGPPGGGSSSGGRPPGRPWASWRLIGFAVALPLVNYWLAASYATKPQPHARIPYSPLFLAQVSAGNVAEITSKGTAIQGQFKRAVIRDKTRVTRF